MVFQREFWTVLIAIADVLGSERFKGALSHVAVAYKT